MSPRVRGVDHRRIYPHTEPQRFQEELYNSGFGDLTAQPQTPGTVLSGLISSVEIDSFNPATVLFQNWSTYVQDNWHVSSRLTLNYGLRWDINPAPRAANGPPLLAVSGTDNPINLAPLPAGTALYKTRWSNLAPRLGFAYAANREAGRETTLRAATGLFYDLGYGPLASSTAGWPYYRTNFYSNTPFPLTADIGRVIQPTDNNPYTGFFADRHLQTPRTYQWNAAVEQSLGRAQTLTVTYVGAIGRKLLRTEYYANPNPNFIYPLITRNGGTSDYHALQAQFQQRLTKGLQALASYTWAHSIDLVSDDSDGLFNSFPGSTVDPRRDRASSDFDARHTFTMAATYEMPKFSGLRGISSALLNGWALNGILTDRSSTPVDLIGGYVNEPFYTSVRPDFNQGQSVYLADPSAPGGRKLNPNSFAMVPSDANGNALRQGTLGRNAVRGFSLNQLDLSVRRRFPVAEQLALEFSADAFNVLNHPNFGQPNRDLTSDLFGRATATFGRDLGGGSTAGGFNTLYQIGGPRSLQLALRLRF